jgi:hypothetical protein
MAKGKAGRPKKTAAEREQIFLSPAQLPALSDRKEFANFWHLSEKYKQFVLHYCAGPFRGNARACAKASGYSMGGTSGCNANRLRHHPKIEAAIREIMTVAGLTPQYVTEKLMQHVQGADMADIEPYMSGAKTLQELRDEGVNTAAIIKMQYSTDERGGITRRAEMSNPVQVLRLAMDNLGMVKQHHVVEKHVTLDFSNMPPERLYRIAHATRRTAGEIDAPTDAEFTLNPSAGDGRDAVAADAGDGGCGVRGDAVAGEVGVGEA